jgi:hypothetical protein
MLLTRSVKSYFPIGNCKSKPIVPGRRLLFQESTLPHGNANAGGLLVRGSEQLMCAYSFTSIIAKIKALCGIPDESAVAHPIVQQGLTRLKQVTTIGVEEEKNYAIFHENGSVK